MRKLLQRDKHHVNITPQLMSTTAPMITQHRTRQEKPVPGKNNLIMPKAVIRSVTPKNVQQCLEAKCIDFSKYNQFITHQ